jgi:DNA-binding MurR/RpiR family transcriptional regulator
MERNSCIAKIQSSLSYATAAEKSIANLLLANPEDIQRLTIEDIATRAGVSLPSVFRFCRQLGYRGFKDFKVALIRDTALSYFFDLESLNDDARPKELSQSVFKNAMANLRETMTFVDHAALEKAAKEILRAERILLFSVSSSLHIALDLFWKFSMAGFHCTHSQDIYAQEAIALNSRKEDVAIGISFSGASRETVYFMEKASQNGTTTICVTSFSDSPITKCSNIKLLTAPVRTRYQQIYLASRISQIVLLDTLFLSVILHDHSDRSEKINLVEEALLHHRVRTAERSKKPPNREIMIPAESTSNSMRRRPISRSK